MYQLFTPAPLLQPYIEQYWLLRSSGQPATLEERIFVDAQADIMFNFGAAYARQNLLGSTDSMTVAHLDAQRDYPIAIAQQGIIDLVGVRFRPGGLAAFVALPLHETSNLTIDLATVFGSGTSDLEARLYDARESLDRVALLDVFFLQRLLPPDALPIARYIADRIIAANGTARIATLSQDIGYSIRSVDRLFKSVFGISPKVYARIVRFQRALALLGAHPTMPLIEIALLCGYYDQAHFTREFAEFAGDTPFVYRALMQTRETDLPPNLVQILQSDSEQMFYL